MKYIKFITILFFLTLICSCSNKKEDINNIAIEKNNSLSTSINQGKDSKINSITVSNENFVNNNFLSINNELFFINNFNNYFLLNAQLTSSKEYLNSSNTKNILSNNLSSITSNNDIIFFSYLNESGIYSFNTITNNIKKLNNDKAINLVHYDNTLYYIHDSKLYSYNLDNNKKTLLISDKINNYIINNNAIFYQNLSDSSSLYYLKINGKTTNKIVDKSVDSFVIYENKLIFSNNNDNNYLYSLNLSTLETSKLLNISASNLKESNGDVYFINLESPNTLCKLIYSNDLNTFSYNTIYNNYINNYCLIDSHLILELPSNEIIIDNLNK